LEQVGRTGPSGGTPLPSSRRSEASREASPAANEDAAAGLAAAQSQEHAYPHRETIESLFHRPVTARAYVDPEACALLDAEAYRAGDRVVFDSAQPTLHTAAHEAAHAVSGADEHTADRAADAVVAGRSASSFLGAAGSAAPAVQAKKAKPKAKKPDPARLSTWG